MPDISSETNNIVGQLMRLYRRSPLHSAGMGKILAGILSRLILFRKNPKIIKDIDNIKFELDLHEVIDSSLYFSGTFEEDVEMNIHSLVKPEMCVIDIGANIGYHTFRMSKLTGPNGRVYAIEPTSWAYQKLIRNASLNPDLNNITFSQVGVSNMDTGMVPVQFQSSYRLDGKQRSTIEHIELITLDTYLERENIKRLDFIKLDVDGFEGKVLQGAAGSLTKMKPSILMELNPATMLENGDDPDGMVLLLVQAGYHFETIHNQPIKDLSTYWRENAKASTMLLATPANL